MKYDPQVILYIGRAQFMGYNTMNFCCHGDWTLLARYILCSYYTIEVMNIYIMQTEEHMQVVCIRQLLYTFTVTMILLLILLVILLLGQNMEYRGVCNCNILTYRRTGFNCDGLIIDVIYCLLYCCLDKICYFVVL